MKLSEYFDLGSMAVSVGSVIKSMVTSPSFLLLSSSSIGILQVFAYRKDLTADLLAAVSILFLLMTLLGLVKHLKTGEWKGEIFLRKTLEQFIVAASVVSLGYVAASFMGVVFKMATQAVPGANPVPGIALYFIFAGYGVMVTYYFIKCCDLIDQILPKLLPKWFSAPFRKYRETGNYKDLIAFTSDEEPETK